MTFFHAAHHFESPSSRFDSDEAGPIFTKLPEPEFVAWLGTLTTRADQLLDFPIPEQFRAEYERGLNGIPAQPDTQDTIAAEV